MMEGNSNYLVHDAGSSVFKLEGIGAGPLGDAPPHVA